MRKDIINFTLLGYTLISMAKVGSAAYLDWEAQDKRAGTTSRSIDYTPPSGFTVFGDFKVIKHHTPGDYKRAARLEAKAKNQFHSMLVGHIPTLVGCFGALYAYKCLEHGKSGRRGAYIMASSAAGVLIVWTAYETIGLPESIILFFPIIASMIAIFAKPSQPGSG